MNSDCIRCILENVRKEEIWGDRDGQARAWYAIVDLCKKLGMKDTGLKSALEDVLNFINERGKNYDERN